MSENDVSSLAITSTMLGTWFSIAILMWIALALILCLKWRCNRGEGRVVVVVLGDTGRSPRMQYHCVSLLNAGYAVDLVGYGGGCVVRTTCMLLHIHSLK